ncbi:MAG: flagellar basal body P-ring formation chaperone FlgA [Fibrobacter sp.]|nr:flagellar basal body P-ring formation chaperone FlgA [Fibrobacter sp.]
MKFNAFVNSNILFCKYAIMVIFAVSCGYGFTIELNFRDSVVVNDTIITFGDIASVNSPDPVISEKIRHFSIGASAPAGFSRFVSADDVVGFMLKPHFVNAKIGINGCKRISVFTDYSKRSVSDYSVAIKDYVKSNLSWPEQCVSISVLDSGTAWNVLKQPLDVAIVGKVNNFAKGTVRVELAANQGNRTYKIPVRCKVNVTVPVIVASRMIKRGELISVDNCEFRKLDITTFGPTPLNSLQNIRDMEALRTIEQGTIIHSRLLKQKPLIEKGDKVMICSKTASVKIYVSATARESGCAGETIWVQNDNSNKLVQVKIMGKGKVSISNRGETI